MREPQTLEEWKKLRGSQLQGELREYLDSRMNEDERFMLVAFLTLCLAKRGRRLLPEQQNLLDGYIREAQQALSWLQSTFAYFRTIERAIQSASTPEQVRAISWDFTQNDRLFTPVDAIGKMAVVEAF